MKAILEFNLDDEDDRRHHTLAVRANDILAALETLDSVLRAEYKYKDMEYVSISHIRAAIAAVMDGDSVDGMSLVCIPGPASPANQD